MVNHSRHPAPRRDAITRSRVRCFSEAFVGFFFASDRLATTRPWSQTGQDAFYRKFWFDETGVAKNYRCLLPRFRPVSVPALGRAAVLGRYGGDLFVPV